MELLETIYIFKVNDIVYSVCYSSFSKKMFSVYITHNNIQIKYFQTFYKPTYKNAQSLLKEALKNS